ncbi:MAG: DUF3021 domain-containing protein [Clostridia bacterium]|nr:DUF3021 domain-containing protein [Clostridia bacterium]
MKQGVLEFIKRGLPVGGFGPLVYAAVMGILGACGVAEAVGTGELALGVFTSYLLAFVAGGITVVYTVDRLPLFWAAFLHGLVLYLDYLVIYLVNGWLKSGYAPVLVFTAIFVAGYLLVWAIIYTVTRRRTEQLNRELTKAESDE